MFYFQLQKLALILGFQRFIFYNSDINSDLVVHFVFRNS